MRRLKVAGGWLTAFAALTSACESPVETNTPPEISLDIVSGSGQTGAVGDELPGALVVKVTKIVRGVAVGVPLQLVNFRVVSGGGSVFAGSAVTDLRGMAREYWTLGSEVGENVLEVRSVDPTTGEKNVFARFTAFGVIPGPEVCNGLDDDLDGTADVATWTYCSGGVPAPNTNGMNACAPDYVDMNAVAADGCERLAGGTWTLSPPIELDCPSLPFPYDVLDVGLRGFEVSVTSGNQIAFKPLLQFSFFGLLDDFVARFIPSFTVPTGPIPESFSGSALFELVDAQFASGTADVSGNISLNGAFTGAASFQATVNLAFDMEMDFTSILLPDLSAACSVNSTVTGTRTGS